MGLHTFSTRKEARIFAKDNNKKVYRISIIRCKWHKGVMKQSKGVIWGVTI